MQFNFETGKDSVMLDVVLPGVFMTVLVLCVAQLGFAAVQGQTQQASATQYAYAISAFAN
jgi:hypothetical protein